MYPQLLQQVPPYCSENDWKCNKNKLELPAGRGETNEAWNECKAVLIYRQVKELPESFGFLPRLPVSVFLICLKTA